MSTSATIHPTANHLERSRSAALRTGWRTSTEGASSAPLCLNKKAKFVPSAEASARINPRIIVSRAVC
jgi:hypothetical protein